MNLLPLNQDRGCSKIRLFCAIGIEQKLECYSPRVKSSFWCFILSGIFSLLFEEGDWTDLTSDLARVTRWSCNTSFPIEKNTHFLCNKKCYGLFSLSVVATMQISHKGNISVVLLLAFYRLSLLLVGAKSFCPRINGNLHSDANSAFLQRTFILWENCLYRPAVMISIFSLGLGVHWGHSLSPLPSCRGSRGVNTSPNANCSSAFSERVR